jgi:hypothetical protein
MARVLLVVLAILGSPACAKTVREQSFPPLHERGVQVTKVAVAPFTAAGGLTQRTAEDAGTQPSSATAIVARNVSEALAARGIVVIPAEDVRRALGLEDPARWRIAPALVARIVAERFGVDGLLLGEVHRYQDRSGEALGSTRPAGVGFVATLYAAPGGEKLWEGVFDETQQDLASNVFNAGRYPGGGTRWLTAEEIARWGAGEVAAALPVAP